MKYFFFLFFSFILSAANAQFVATMELKEKVPGICDMTKVYVLFAGFDGQNEMSADQRRDYGSLESGGSVCKG